MQIVAMWKLVPICITWCLWWEQNDQVFEDKECSLEVIRYYLLTLYFNTIDV